MTEGFKDKPCRIDPYAPDGFIHLLAREDIDRWEARRRAIAAYMNQDMFYVYGDDESVRPQNLAVLTAPPGRTLDMHMIGHGEDTGLRWTPAENVRGVTVEHEPDRGDGISRGKIVIKAAIME